MSQRIKAQFVSVAKIIKRNEPTIKATCFFYIIRVSPINESRYGRLKP